MKRGNLLRKPEKHDKNDSLTLVLIYHPTLNKVPKILQKTQTYCLFTKVKRTITITLSSCISQRKNTERSFSKTKLKTCDSYDEEIGIC